MQDWVSKEIKHCQMADKRLVKRLGSLLETRGSDPEKSIPLASEKWSEIVGAYRFIGNRRVTLESILSGHRQATIERIQSERVALIPQDTTFFNFAKQKDNDGFGTIKKHESDKQLLHVSSAYTPARVNLGVISATLWKRPEGEEVKAKRTASIEEKESIRWLNHYRQACDIQNQCPETTVVSVADREGDIHEWYELADSLPHEKQAAYIIRAKSNRRIELDNGKFAKIWDYVPRTKKLGDYQLYIPSKGGQKARTATLNVYAKATTIVGRESDRRTPVEVYVVFAKESNPPKGIKGIEWVLVTNIAVESFDEAMTIIQWYRARREIEIFFRVLKGGCNINALRLTTVERIENCIAVYLIVSWHIQNVTMMARSMPELPCTKVFSEKEWKCIMMMREKKRHEGPPPSVYVATRALAMIGGFMGRKGDGEPGVKTIWTGFQRLYDFIESMELLQSI